MSDKANAAELGFDPSALKAKYRAERDKRLRQDANEQYVEIKGQFAHYLEDPYVEPGFARAPLSDEVDVVVVGGGFGGLLAGARLREVGVESVRMIEKGGDFGGTWYWNRYPGAACDIESYIYLPLLEEVGYMPVEKYSKAAEILAHSQAIGRHFDLYRDVLFQTEATELRWDEEIARWIVHTNRGDAIKARFVVTASGPLHRPKLPGIPGIEGFKGHSFHTSRWDYDYTGGDCNGGLEKLKDKRVGIIGTGATAVQCVPHLGAHAKELYVFQRTPSSIDVRNNRPTDREWVKTLTPGWQQYRMDNFNTLVSGGFQEENLVNDGWTDIIGNLLVMARKRVDGHSPAEMAEIVQLADFQKMESIRKRVEEVVQDSSTAEALKPWYMMMCKRPCFHEDYLPTFNRPNVHLVDTHGKGITEINEKGPVFDGVQYELDLLIYATGFEIQKTGIYNQIIGANGVELNDKYKDGIRTLLGIHSKGYPNLFIMNGYQASFQFNLTDMMQSQGGHIAACIDHVRKHGYQALDVTEDAEEFWVQEVIKYRGKTDRNKQCTPGYYNFEGEDNRRQDGTYNGGFVKYMAHLADVERDMEKHFTFSKK